MSVVRPLYSPQCQTHPRHLTPSHSHPHPWQHQNPLPSGSRISPRFPTRDPKEPCVQVEVVLRGGRRAACCREICLGREHGLQDGYWEESVSNFP